MNNYFCFCSWQKMIEVRKSNQHTNFFQAYQRIWHRQKNIIVSCQLKHKIQYLIYSRSLFFIIDHMTLDQSVHKFSLYYKLYSFNSTCLLSNLTFISITWKLSTSISLVHQKTYFPDTYDIKWSIKYSLPILYFNISI